MLDYKKICPLPQSKEGMKAKLLEIEKDPYYIPYINKLTKQAAKLLQCAK